MKSLSLCSSFRATACVYQHSEIGLSTKNASQIRKKFCTFKIHNIQILVLHILFFTIASKNSSSNLKVRFSSLTVKQFKISSGLEKPDCKLHHVYRALEILAKENDFFQSQLYKNSEMVLNRHKRVLYYDCTNYYFEIEEADEKRWQIEEYFRIMKSEHAVSPR